MSSDFPYGISRQIYLVIDTYFFAGSIGILSPTNILQLKKVCRHLITDQGTDIRNNSFPQK
jgi:hypothetical protein